MTKKTSIPALTLLLLLSGCASTPPDPAALIAEADRALGGPALKTLRVVGRGSGSTFGQAWQPSFAWPALNYSTLTRDYDYANGALREDYARSRAEPNGGGAVPLMGQGEQRVSGFARENWAWNGSGAAATAAPVSLDGRIHDLWTSPHGVIKAAQRHGATAGTASDGGRSFRTLTVAVPGRLRATAWIDEAGLVTRVDSRLPHPVLGDTEVSTTYSDWRDQGGVKLPMRQRTRLGGFEVLDLALQEVQVNPALDIQVPDAVRNASERVTADKVADGVWFLAGGSHNSVAIEMADGIVVVESPLYDGRAVAMLDAAAKLVPGKNVTTVINSHHHFDHAGGLRAAAARGATLVTSAMARPYFERVFANPNAIAPDLLAKSGRSARFVGVDGRHQIADATRRIEVHEMRGSIHAQGFLLVWLPQERLLIQADAFTPGPPNAAPPAVPNANNVNLADNVERLGLKVDRILPLHSRVVPYAELLRAIGRPS
jgi:glyoxylase-like metal-dependent hydrolase (beta-lactamase superfamily II)